MSAHLDILAADIRPAAIPSFLIGQDAGGQWIAIDTRGLKGGFFVTREAAEDYAADETDHRPDAVGFAKAPLDLSLGLR